MSHTHAHAHVHAYPCSFTGNRLPIFTVIGNVVILCVTCHMSCWPGGCTSVPSLSLSLCVCVCVMILCNLLLSPLLLLLLCCCCVYKIADTIKTMVQIYHYFLTLITILNIVSFKACRVVVGWPTCSHRFIYFYLHCCIYSKFKQLSSSLLI